MVDETTNDLTPTDPSSLPDDSQVPASPLTQAAKPTPFAPAPAPATPAPAVGLPQVPYVASDTKKPVSGVVPGKFGEAEVPDSTKKQQKEDAEAAAQKQNTIGPAPTGAVAWLENLRGEIMKRVAPAHFDESGARIPHTFGDIVGGAVAGPAQIAEGVVQHGEASRARAKNIFPTADEESKINKEDVAGANNIVGGFFSTVGPVALATQPEAIPFMTAYSGASAASNKGLTAAGLSPETSELITNVALLAGPGLYHASEISGRGAEAAKQGQQAAVNLSHSIALRALEMSPNLSEQSPAAQSWVINDAAHSLMSDYASNEKDQRAWAMKLVGLDPSKYLDDASAHESAAPVQKVLDAEPVATPSEQKALPPAPPHITFDSIGGTEVKAPEPATRPSELSPNREVMQQDHARAGGQGEQTDNLPALHPEEHAELEQQAGRPLTTAEAVNFRNNQLITQTNQRMAATGEGTRDEVSNAREPHRAELEPVGVGSALESRKAPEIQAEGPEWERTHNIIVDGNKVGSVMVKTDPEGHAQLAGAVVDPSLRGQGLAQAAYRSAIAEAQANGATRVTSDSTHVSPDANRVWEALKAKGLPVENITHPNGTKGYQIDFENPAEVSLPATKATFADAAKTAGVEFWGVQQGMGDKAIAIFQDPVSKTSFTVDTKDWSPEKFQASLKAARDRMTPPEPKFEQALARRGEMPNQTVNLAPAYGETGKYVGGHVEHRLSGESPEEKRQQYIDNLGVTQGTDLQSILPGLLAAGSTEHDVGTHEIAHIAQLHLEGFPTAGTDVLSNYHPETHPHAAASTILPYNKIPGAIVRSNGTVGFSPSRLAEVGPSLIRVLLAGGHLQEQAHGLDFDSNEGLYSDLQAAHKLLAAMGFTSDQFPAAIAAERENLAKQWTPEMVAAVKAGSAEREEGLSRTLVTSAAKVQEIIKNIQEAQNEGNNSSVSRTGGATNPKTQPRAEGGDAKENTSAVSTRAEARKVKQNPPAGFIDNAGAFISFPPGIYTHPDFADDYGMSVNDLLSEGWVRKANPGSYEVFRLYPPTVKAMELDIIKDFADLKKANKERKNSGNIVVNINGRDREITPEDFIDAYNGDLEKALKAGGARIAPKLESRKTLKAEESVLDTLEKAEDVNMRPIQYDPNKPFTNTNGPSFIFPDGRITNARTSHVQIAQAAGFDPEGGSSAPSVAQFQKATGAIRVMYPMRGRMGSIGLELQHPPTEQQVQLLTTTIKHAAEVGVGDGHLVWDLAKPEGGRVTGDGSVGEFIRAVDKWKETSATVSAGLESRKLSKSEKLIEAAKENGFPVASPDDDVYPPERAYIAPNGDYLNADDIDHYGVSELYKDKNGEDTVRDEEAIVKFLNDTGAVRYRFDGDNVLIHLGHIKPSDAQLSAMIKAYREVSVQGLDEEDNRGSIQIAKDGPEYPNANKVIDLPQTTRPGELRRKIEEMYAPEGASVASKIESRKALSVSPNKTLQASAQKYAAAHDMPEIDHSPVEADPERAKEIAKMYDEAEHAPNDPRVKAAYDALKAETLEQFHHLRDDLGLKFDPTEKDPYSSAAEMMSDIKKNNRLKVFTGSSTGEDHPLSAIAPGTGGNSYNTVFRWVHDAMGHAAGGHDFSENGEKSATEAHAQMYSDTARPAMRAETEGQTSWFFHNPEVESGRAEPGKFAEQKAIILPDTSADWHKKAGDMAASQDAGGINPRTGKSDTKGKGVELIPELRQPLEHVPTAADFHDFYEQRKELYDDYPQLRVGWDNNSGEEGGHEINVGAVGPGAPAVAKKLDQIAAFDIEKGENIPTGGSGKTREFPDYSFDQRLEDLGKSEVDSKLSGSVPKQIKTFLKTDTGEPMVFYHGSPTKGIQQIEFKPGKNSTIFGSEPTQRVGLFVTPDKNFAAEFAGKNGEVTAHTLHLDNPVDLRHDMPDKFVNEMVGQGISRNWLLNGGAMWELFDGEDGQIFVDALKKAGYDGAIIREPNDDKTSVDSYIAFAPEKVKPVGGASISPKLESRKDSAQNSLALETPKSSAPKQLTGAAKGATKPLMKQPLTIEGTGDNGRTTLFDLAGALGKWSQEGLKPDKEIKNALDRSRAEMTYQIAQDNGDANWYKKDTKDAIEHLQANGFPELEKPVNEKLFRTMWAITSYGVDPDANLTSAAEAWKQYQATGKMPLMADEKTNWPGYSGIKGSITLLNKLLDEKGEAGTMDWLLSKHPVSEIREQKAKTHTAATVPGRASDERYGAFIFGPKAGAFMLNLQGVSEHTTVDVWGARMIRRWTGTLSPETIDQPLTSEEARNFHHVIESMGKEFGLDTADAQAVLWGYEHDLYKAHGVGEAAKSYKTAAEKYVQRKQGGTNNEFIREQSDLFGQRYGSSGKKTEGVGKNAATEGRAPSSKKGIDAQSLIAALGGLKKPASEFPSDISVSPWMTDADGDHRLELTKKGKLAGLIQYGADPIGGSAEIHDVYLDESLRGKGLGTKLYEQAFKHAAAQGLMSVTSDEAEISDAAQKVWRGLKASGKYDITKSTHEDGYPKFTAWLGGKK